MPVAAEPTVACFEAAANLHQLSTLFVRQFRDFGLTSFAMGTLPGPSRESDIFASNWPAEWVQRYAVNGYAAEDIGVEAARLAPEPFTWTEIKARRPGAAPRLLATAAEFGWLDGFIVPVHDREGPRGLVATMGPCVRFGPGDRDRAAALALGAYRRAESLFRTRTSPKPLTRCERNALALVAEGCDDAAIAATLGITRNSAHAYVERAKRRLGAATRAQAVALALAARLI